MATPYRVDSATGVGTFVRFLVAWQREQGGNPLISEPSGQGVRGFETLFLALSSVLTLFRFRRQVDIVHCQQFHPQSLSVAVAARMLGKGVVVTVHGRSPSPLGLRGLVFRIAERWTKRIARDIVFVAASLRAEFGGVGGVIPNGVPAQDIQSLRTSREVVRTELGLADAFVIAYVGRVTADKGVLDLLQAYRSVVANSPLVRLVLVGPVDLNLRPAIEGASREGVISLGPRTDVWRLMAGADLFVLPSTREGLPFSLLEAMAAGLPVVATRVGDVPQAVPSDAGVLISPSDPAALTATLQSAVDHPEHWAAMGRRAQEHVRQEYTLDRTYAAYGDIYDRLRRSR